MNQLISEMMDVKSKYLTKKQILLLNKLIKIDRSNPQKLEGGLETIVATLRSNIERQIYETLS